MNLANQITLVRIFLVPVFLGALIYYSPEKSYLLFVSISVFLLACMTDAVDGYLARRLHQKTTLGSYIDPMADKLLLVSGFLSLSFMNHLPASTRIPAWVTIPVITRDALILVGALMIFLTTGKLKAQPLPVGKATTVSQMVTLFLSLISAAPSIQLFFFVATVGLTILSGVFYLRLGGKILQAI